MSRKNETAAARVLVSDAAYDDSMERVIASILDEFPIEWRGRKTLIKPNMLGPFTPEEGVTTHPVMVRAVVRQLLGRGAEVIVGDNPGMSGYGASDRVARTTGIAEASEGRLVNLGRNPVRRQISSKYMKHITIAGDVLDADVVVNLPKLKTHGLTILSGAVKNTFGHVSGGDKMRTHSLATTPRRFAEALLDIYRIRPPELNIMDAVVAMEGNGPSKGELRVMGKVLASDNAVTLDAVALNLIGRQNREVPYIEIAGRTGLGEIDIKKISIIGEYTPVNDFKLPNTFVPGFTGVLLNRFLSRWVNCVPEVMDETCCACGICVEHCPVNAMQMGENYPKADRDKCISCYCCQEMCPEGAIKLTGRTINWLRKAYNPQFYKSQSRPQ